jgi:hypothetical protein
MALPPADAWKSTLQSANLTTSGRRLGWFMTRRLSMLVAVLAVAASAAGVGAETRGQEQKAAQVQAKSPFQIYVAKGEANACGEGCSEWIAVEGHFDGGAGGRMRAFLKRHGARKLPIYFHSPGGDGGAGMAIGRLLRERGVTAGVGTTVPRA